MLVRMPIATKERPAFGVGEGVAPRNALAVSVARVAAAVNQSHAVVAARLLVKAGGKQRHIGPQTRTGNEDPDHAASFRGRLRRDAW
jgi:hypothetical protein